MDRINYYNVDIREILYYYSLDTIKLFLKNSKKDKRLKILYSYLLTKLFSCEYIADSIISYLLYIDELTIMKYQVAQLYTVFAYKDAPTCINPSSTYCAEDLDTISYYIGILRYINTIDNRLFDPSKCTKCNKIMPWVKIVSFNCYCPYCNKLIINKICNIIITIPQISDYLNIL